MKKVLIFIPFVLFTIAIVSFIIPVVYDKEGELLISYNMYDLIFGLGDRDVSIGLLMAFLLFITAIIFAITTIKNSSNFRVGISVIFGLTSGTLFFFARMLANPTLNGLRINAGLIIPSVFIILGTILLFVSTKIIIKKDSVKD